MRYKILAPEEQEGKRGEAGKEEKQIKGDTVTKLVSLTGHTGCLPVKVNGPLCLRMGNEERKERKSN